MILPGALPDADPFVKAVDEAASAYKAGPTEVTRIKLREASIALQRSVESIPEAVFKVNFALVPPIVIRTAIEGGWFDYLMKAGRPVTADELSKATGAEKGLVTRYMRVLIAEDAVSETGLETYAPSRTTLAYTIPGLKDAVIHVVDNVMPSFTGLPQYLKNTKYKEPQDDNLGPYVVAHGKQFFTHLELEPERRRSFNLFMTAQKVSHGGAGGWLDVFPMQQRLSKPESSEPHLPEPENKAKADIPPPTLIVEKVEPDKLSHGEVPGTDAAAIRQADATPDEIKQAPPASVSGLPASQDETLIVDMGGGNGHELLEFRRRFPKSTYPGRVVLQDLPATFSHVDIAALEKDGVEVMEHDFFKPQPVNGAQFYYMASVIHDWSDADCTVILNNIKPAMKINHSSILVVDLVVPEERVPHWHAMLDITLLAIMCGKERNRKELAKVVEGCGLKVLAVAMLETGEGVTEIVLEGDERLKGTEG